MHAPGHDVGTWIVLEALDGQDGSGWYGGGGAGTTGEDHRVTMKDLQQGRYRVKAWNDETDGIEVRVPCGEILYERKTIQAYRVKSLKQDKRGYAAGLRKIWQRNIIIHNNHFHLAPKSPCPFGR